MEEYSRIELFDIARELIDDLRDCDDCTIITTNRLASESGYSDFSNEDLLFIHNSLLSLAKKSKIKLEFLESEDREGASYDSEYVVKNKKAQIKCPYCGSTNTGRYLYGFPCFSENLQKKMDSGKIILGGCKVTLASIGGYTLDGNPHRHCNECKKDFAKSPVLFNKKTGSWETYIDQVRSIRFLVGGYFGGSTEIHIRENDKGALVRVWSFPAIEEMVQERQITSGKWSHILIKLYKDMYLHEWKKDYTDPYVLDGEQWELEIGLNGGRKRTYHGSNDYPPYWPELRAIFREFAKF